MNFSFSFTKFTMPHWVCPISAIAFVPPDQPLSILAVALAVRLIRWDTSNRVSDEDESESEQK